MQRLCSDTIVISQHSRHRICHGDVMCCGFRKQFLIQCGDFDKWVRGTQLKRKNGVAEIVPVNDEVSVP